MRNLRKGKQFSGGPGHTAGGARVLLLDKSPPDGGGLPLQSLTLQGE